MPAAFSRLVGVVNLLQVSLQPLDFAPALQPVLVVALCSHLFSNLMEHLLEMVHIMELFLHFLLASGYSEIPHHLNGPVLYPAVGSRERQARLCHGVWWCPWALGIHR